MIDEARINPDVAIYISLLKESSNTKETNRALTARHRQGGIIFFPRFFVDLKIKFVFQIWKNYNFCTICVITFFASLFNIIFFLL